MLIILMPRLDISHILNYKLDNCNYRSICGKTIACNPTMIILAADNTYSGLCGDCKIKSDNYILHDLNYSIRSARNQYQENIYNLREYIQDEMFAPEDKYIFSRNGNWNKLKKYKKYRKK